MRLRSDVLMRLTLLLLGSLLLGGSAWASTIPVVDLTNPIDKSEGWLTGSTGGEALFRYYRPPGKNITGTGVINAFVRINPGGSQTSEQGYNTDKRKTQYDENSSPEFTRSLPLNWVPSYNFADKDAPPEYYFEFLLDINQYNSDPLLSLTNLEIWLRKAPNLLGHEDDADGGFNDGIRIWELDTGAEDRVDLNYSWNHGSGAGDMLVYIPFSYETYERALKEDYTWVYLYSAFGGPELASEPPFQTNDGYEEWSVIWNRNGNAHDDDPPPPPSPYSPPPPPPPPPPVIPEPGSLILLGTGLVGLGLAARRRIG